MTTIKIIPDTDYLSFFSEQLREKGIKEGDKFTIKFKRGRRWKFKSFRLIQKGSFKCECCGSYEQISLSKGEVGKMSIFSFDSHFGPSSVLPMITRFKK